MSYILDALRKAQQDQRKGQPPDVRLSVGEGAGSRSRRAVWPWIVAALAVNALVLVWALWPRAPEPVAVARSVAPRPPAAQAPKPAGRPAMPTNQLPVGVPKPIPEARPQPQADTRALAAEAKVAAVPPAERQPEPVVQPLPPTPAAPPPVTAATPEVSPTTQPAPAPDAAVPVAPSAPLPPAPSDRSGPGTPGGRSVVASPAPLRTQPSPAPGSGGRPLPAPSPTLPPPQPVPAPAAQASAAAPARTASPGQPPLLQDLPLAVRQGLPEIEINGHVYAESPGQRFVFIKWQGYREGDRIGGPQGPLLEKITPEGLVVDFGSVRARVNVAP